MGGGTSIGAALGSLASSRVDASVFGPRGISTQARVTGPGSSSNERFARSLVERFDSDRSGTLDAAELRAAMDRGAAAAVLGRAGITSTSGGDATSATALWEQAKLDAARSKAGRGDALMRAFAESDERDRVRGGDRGGRGDRSRGFDWLSSGLG